MAPSSSPSLSPSKAITLWAMLFLFSATLHSAEAALTKISRWKIQEFVESEGPQSPFAKLTPRHLSALLTAMLLSTTACSIYSTALYVEALHAFFPALSLGFVSLSLTVITLFFGELIPKAMAVSNSELVVRKLLPFVQRLAWLLQPLTMVINFLSDAVLSAVFGVRSPRARPPAPPAAAAVLSSSSSSSRASSSLSPSLSLSASAASLSAATSKPSTATTQRTYTTSGRAAARESKEGEDHGEDVSEDMLRMVVAEAARTEQIESGEHRMIQNVLDMEDKEVNKIMTPRVEITALPATAPLEDVLAAALRSKCSRIPIYDEDIDRVVGVVFSKDLLDFVNTAHSHGNGDDTKEPWNLSHKQKKSVSPSAAAVATPTASTSGVVNTSAKSAEKTAPLIARDIAKSVYFIPESMSCWDALQQMKSRRAHMAIVVDEYGGTAGLVTLEDLLEEVVGEIYDEDDDRAEQVEDWTIFKRDRDTFVVKAHAELDDVFEALHIDKEKLFKTELHGNFAMSKENGADAVEECSTIGGLLCALAGCIPREGDVITFAGYSFLVMKVEGQRRLVDILVEPLVKENNESETIPHISSDSLGDMSEGNGVTASVDDNAVSSTVGAGNRSKEEELEFFPSQTSMENDLSGTFSNRFKIFRDGEWVSPETV